MNHLHAVTQSAGLALVDGGPPWICIKHAHEYLVAEREAVPGVVTQGRRARDVAMSLMRHSAASGRSLDRDSVTCGAGVKHLQKMSLVMKQPFNECAEAA